MIQVLLNMLLTSFQPSTYFLHSVFYAVCNILLIFGKQSTININDMMLVFVTNANCVLDGYILLVALCIASVMVLNVEFILDFKWYHLIFQVLCQQLCHILSFFQWLVFLFCWLPLTTQLSTQVCLQDCVVYMDVFTYICIVVEFDLMS